MYIWIRVCNRCRYVYIWLMWIRVCNRCRYVCGALRVDKGMGMQHVYAYT